MEPILIALAVLVLVLVIGLVVRKAGGGPDPENPVGPTRRQGTATGTEDASRPDITRYPTGSRPGGPGAESMNPAEPGDPVPGTEAGEEDSGLPTKPSEAKRRPLDEEG